MDEQPRRLFGLISGRPASLIDWLVVLAILVIIALFAHNAFWQRYLDREEAESMARWEKTWGHLPPDQRVRPWVPDRRFRLPFDWGVR